jgi:hypothetical protein
MPFFKAVQEHKFGLDQETLVQLALLLDLSLAACAWRPLDQCLVRQSDVGNKFKQADGGGSVLLKKCAFGTRRECRIAPEPHFDCLRLIHGFKTHNIAEFELITFEFTRVANYDLFAGRV